MKLRVEVTPKALSDLEKIAHYIAQDNLGAAMRFLEAAEATLAQLAEMPLMGGRTDIS